MKTADENYNYDPAIDPDDDSTESSYAGTEPATEDVLDDDDDLHEVQTGDDLDEPDASDSGITGAEDGSDSMDDGSDGLTETDEDSEELTDTDDDTDLTDPDLKDEDE